MGFSPVPWGGVVDSTNNNSVSCQTSLSIFQAKAGFFLAIVVSKRRFLNNAIF
jgi:hypothetical protein